MYLTDREIARLCGLEYSEYNKEFFSHKECYDPLIYPFIPYSYNIYTTSVGLSTCGYDIRLGSKFKKITGGEVNYVTGVIDETYQENENTVTLFPNDFVLAHSVEYIKMPADLVGFVLDKSSLARRGLSVQNTCIEPGWEGIITLELHNMSSRNIILVKDMGIAQLCFSSLVGTPIKPYNIKNNGNPGKYQRQIGVQPAR